MCELLFLRGTLVWNMQGNIRFNLLLAISSFFFILPWFLCGWRVVVQTSFRRKDHSFELCDVMLGFLQGIAVQPNQILSNKSKYIWNIQPNFHIIAKKHYHLPLLTEFKRARNLCRKWMLFLGATENTAPLNFCHWISLDIWQKAKAENRNLYFNI